jgi:uncharacterized protein (DUF305 family)
MATDPVALTDQPMTRTRRRVRYITSLPRRSTLVSPQSSRSFSRQTVLVAALLAVAAIAILVTALLIFMRDRPPGEHSVDAGFARDMSVHHGQAVQMAITVHDRTDNEAIKLLSLDIMLTQHGQFGIMQGWLDAWDLPSVGEDPPMTWMGSGTHDAMAAMASMEGMDSVPSKETSSDNTMPGWATQEELASLSTLPVAEMNKEFLRLMIRHHQGGVLMAQAAVDRAETPQIKDLSRWIVQTQQSEISQMEQILTEISS